MLKIALDHKSLSITDILLMPTTVKTFNLGDNFSKSLDGSTVVDAPGLEPQS